MFKNLNSSQPQPSLAQTVFSEQCIRANQVPFVSPSDEVLDDTLIIINLYHQAAARMQSGLTRDILREIEQVVHGTLYQSCQRVIASPTFNQLIASLQLTAHKAQLLSMRKLGALLMVELFAEQNQRPTPAASSTSVANLFGRLNSIGISFEMLASIEDKQFELIVSGANQLLKLSDDNVPLNKLLELRYIHLWALTVPSAAKENTVVTMSRQQAIDLLNTIGLLNTHGN